MTWLLWALGALVLLWIAHAAFIALRFPEGSRVPWLAWLNRPRPALAVWPEKRLLGLIHQMRVGALFTDQDGYRWRLVRPVADQAAWYVAPAGWRSWFADLTYHGYYALASVIWYPYGWRIWHRPWWEWPLDWAARRDAGIWQKDKPVYFTVPVWIGRGRRVRFAIYMYSRKHDGWRSARYV